MNFQRELSIQSCKSFPRKCQRDQGYTLVDYSISDIHDEFLKVDGMAWGVDYGVLFIKGYQVG
jgi:hypothetical protein